MHLQMVDDIIDVTEAAGVAGKETAVDMQVSVTLVIRAVGTYVCISVCVLMDLFSAWICDRADSICQ